MHPSIHPSIWSSYLSICPKAFFLGRSQREIQRDFLNFCTWQRQKRRNSATLPHFFKLTTSKTKQFCETSFKNGKLSAELTASYQCVLRFFDSTCLNYCACHEKVMPGHGKCCACHAKSSQQTWRSDAPTPLRKSAPWPPNISDKHVSCTAPATEIDCIFADPLWMSYACHRFWKCYKTLTFCSLLTRCRIPCARHAERHLNVQSVRTPGAFNILTSKCASRHNGVQFFDISTSKSGPDLLRFVHFDFHMCFAPQRRALFRHLNFQKWSGPGVFCTFWLRHVLRATTACTFSTSQLFSTSKSAPNVRCF